LGGHVAAVGSGMVLTGIGTYVFLALAGQQMSTANFAAFSAGWSVLLVASAGLYIPLEMETSRRFSSRPGAPGQLSSAVRLGATLAVGVAVATAALWRPLMDLLDGDALAGVSLPLLCAASAVLMPLRGRAAAAGRFGAYAVSLIVETLARCTIAGAAVLAGDGAPGPVLLSLPVAALLAGAALSRAPAPGTAPGPDPRATTSPAGRAHRPQDVAGLIIGSVLAQMLLNLPPVLIKGLQSGGEMAGPVLAGLTLARIPLFLSPALIAPLLPQLVSLHERGEHARVARITAAVLGALALAAVAGSAAAVPLGGPLTRLLFGPDLGLAGGQVAILVLGAMAFLAGQFASSVLVAVEQHGWVGLGWAAGLASFAMPRAVVDDPVTASECGLAVGAIVATAVFVGALLLTRPAGAGVGRR
jgi:O-antigen/teichoic acid export membrane protein